MKPSDRAEHYGSDKLNQSEGERQAETEAEAEAEGHVRSQSEHSVIDHSVISDRSDHDGGTDTDSDGDTQQDRCLFCQSVVPSGDEAALDAHMAHDCPVLMACSCCDNFVEAFLYDAHLREECSARPVLQRCDTCRVAVPVDDFVAHVAKGLCRPPDSADSTRCPWCMASFPSCASSEENDDAFQAVTHHLVHECRHNPRRRR
ncbi:MAG: hypothetical protein MHM6MM_008677 [Cercozoa sp. M6MM]